VVVLVDDEDKDDEKFKKKVRRRINKWINELRVYSDGCGVGDGERW
jgi:hypothetical protein